MNKTIKVTIIVIIQLNSTQYVLLKYIIRHACMCVCVCVHVYVVYEDTNLYNDIGMT